jgi:DNA-binding CsgD family transcriptional regulator
MQEAEEVLRLVGKIYDAALDSTLWPDALRGIAAYVHGASASLFIKDAAVRSGGIVHDDGGISPDHKRTYFEKYIKLDPTTTGQFFARIGEPIATADLVPYEEFLKSRFYREWARPQGLVDFATVALDKTATGAAFCGVFRHARQGVVDEAMRQRMRLLAPHIRRAVLIARTIDLKTVEAATFAETLDALSAGLFLVDGGMKIIHANAAGHAMLAAGDCLKATNGSLAVRDLGAARLLRDSVAAAGEGDAAIGTAGIAVPLAAAGDALPYVAHVLPLTSGDRRRAGGAHAAAAALFVHKAAPEMPSPPEAIARQYSLTSTELRVLFAIVEIGGAPEVADALGVSIQTIKTHLHHLYAKTGSARQADLVKLVLAFSNPLAR